jgi:hypothetical protein
VVRRRVWSRGDSKTEETPHLTFSCLTTTLPAASPALLSAPLVLLHSWSCAGAVRPNGFIWGFGKHLFMQSTPMLSPHTCSPSQYPLSTPFCLLSMDSHTSHQKLPPLEAVVPYTLNTTKHQRMYQFLVELRKSVIRQKQQHRHTLSSAFDAATTMRIGCSRTIL